MKFTNCWVALGMGRLAVDKQTVEWEQFQQTKMKPV